MTAILPPKYDKVCKMLFGDEQNTDVLTDFLRAVLPLPDDEYSHPRRPSSRGHAIIRDGKYIPAG
jgi:hypothetical protein